MTEITVYVDMIDDGDKLALESIVNGIESALENDKRIGVIKEYGVVTSDA